MRTLGRAAIVSILSVAAILPTQTAPAVAAEPQFPTGQSGFHTYAEMVDEVEAAAADHPAIVQRFSIGSSYQGRALWAAKVSDNVATDEAEPEVLFDGLHHGDEHMSLEMTLSILRWLTTGYGTDPRITELVDEREIWIVFALNPDGATYDIGGTGGYRNWRKNRQPTPGSSARGTDLNRNYPYHWGCCGGASSNPASSRFRGPKPLSAPETKAFVDFVRSRVVGGRQQIRAAVSFHTTGRLVMYPYGHTYSNIPSDMTRDDRAVFAALAKRMADANGYRPIQASDLYITSGTSRDWLYGQYRIFAFTIEMSPDSTPYPDDSRIGPETGRNRESVLRVLEQAACPFALIDKAKTRCGAFDDDLEVARGWKVNADGTDTAVRGAWSRADPKATASSGPKQPGGVPSGIRGFVTGAAAGSGASANDLDGGTTTARSPAIALPADLGQRLTFRYVFAHGANASSADSFRVAILDAAGATTVFTVLGAAVDRDGAWSTGSVSLDRWAGETIRIRLSATDRGKASLVEAVVDDVRITRP